MRRLRMSTVEFLQRSLSHAGRICRTHRRRTGPSSYSYSTGSVVERLEHRTLLAAVAAPTIHLNPDADTGRSNSDNIVNSLSAADFVISGGNVSGLSSDIDVVTGPTLLEDGSNSPDFEEGRHAYTAQMIVKFSSDVAGASGGVADNITFPAHFIHSSDTLIITIDETAPDAPTVSLAPALTGQLPDSFIAGVTNNSQTAFQGTAEADAIVRLFVDGELAGLTLASPVDGNVAFADGHWSLTPTIDLNDPAFFPVDGLREITVTAEDRAGNISEEASLNIFVDTQGPRITAVDVNEQNNSYDLFSPKPSTDGSTPPVSSLVISVQDLPFRSDAESEFRYDALWEPIAENPAHYVLVGDHSGIIPISSINFETVDEDGELIGSPNDGEAAFGRITLAFSEFLPDDRYTLTISDELVDPAGNALDGGSNASGPHEEPAFPSGDGQAGGGFTARFTVDSRPEIGVIGQDSIAVDINGNDQFDPNALAGSDSVNRDLVFDFGIQTDAVFAGQFTEATAGGSDGFDRLGAYGRVNGQYRWLLDFDNNGVPDNGSGAGASEGVASLLQLNAIPFAGDFDPDHPGDEIGFFTGTTWYFDTDGDNNIGPSLNINAVSGDTAFAGDMRGRPIVGDFDGDGFDDLATHRATQSENRFYFDLTSANDGTPGVLDGSADDTIDFGFPGVLEKPFAADFNLDGIDDIGLMLPNQIGQTPSDTSGWYFLISNAALQSDGTVDALNHDFSPDPLGNDLFAQFGSNLGLPLVGNFDPPTTGSSQASAARGGTSASSSLQGTSSVIAAPSGIVVTQGNDPSDRGLAASSVFSNVSPASDAAVHDDHTEQVDSQLPHTNGGNGGSSPLMTDSNDEASPAGSADGGVPGDRDHAADDTTDESSIADEVPDMHGSLTPGLNPLTDAR